MRRVLIFGGTVLALSVSLGAFAAKENPTANSAGRFVDTSGGATGLASVAPMASNITVRSPTSIVLQRRRENSVGVVSPFMRLAMPLESR
jgi:hypothetical protein